MNTLMEHKQKDQKLARAKVIVATLPGFVHLKKAIFELKKSDDFNKVFDIKYVVTKVAAKNFYTSKNRNYFQFLVENCMKGVSNAIIFEK